MWTWQIRKSNILLSLMKIPLLGDSIASYRQTANGSGRKHCRDVGTETQAIGHGSDAWTGRCSQPCESLPLLAPMDGNSLSLLSGRWDFKNLELGVWGGSQDLTMIAEIELKNCRSSRESTKSHSSCGVWFNCSEKKAIEMELFWKNFRSGAALSGFGFAMDQWEYVQSWALRYSKNFHRPKRSFIMAYLLFSKGQSLPKSGSLFTLLATINQNKIWQFNDRIQVFTLQIWEKTSTGPIQKWQNTIVKERDWTEANTHWNAKERLGPRLKGIAKHNTQNLRHPSFLNNSKYQRYRYVEALVLMSFRPPTKCVFKRQNLQLNDQVTFAY